MAYSANLTKGDGVHARRLRPRQFDRGQDAEEVYEMRLDIVFERGGLVRSKNICMARNRPVRAPFRARLMEAAFMFV